MSKRNVKYIVGQRLPFERHIKLSEHKTISKCLREVFSVFLGLDVVFLIRHLPDAALVDVDIPDDSFTKVDEVVKLCCPTSQVSSLDDSKQIIQSTLDTYSGFFT